MMLNDVAVFDAKLDLFSQQLHERHYTHFSVLHSQVTKLCSFSPRLYLRELKDQFCTHILDWLFWKTHPTLIQCAEKKKPALDVGMCVKLLSPKWE